MVAAIANFSESDHLRTHAVLTSTRRRSQRNNPLHVLSPSMPKGGSTVIPSQLWSRLFDAAMIIVGIVVGENRRPSVYTNTSSLHHVHAQVMILFGGADKALQVREMTADPVAACRIELPKASSGTFSRITICWVPLREKGSAPISCACFASFACFDSPRKENKDCRLQHDPTKSIITRTRQDTHRTRTRHGRGRQREKIITVHHCHNVGRISDRHKRATFCTSWTTIYYIGKKRPACSIEQRHRTQYMFRKYCILSKVCYLRQ